MRLLLILQTLMLVPCVAKCPLTSSILLNSTTLSREEHCRIKGTIHSDNVEELSRKYNLSLTGAGSTWVNTLEGLTYCFDTEDYFTINTARQFGISVITQLKTITNDNFITKDIPDYTNLDLKDFHITISNTSASTSDELDERIVMIFIANGIIHYARVRYGDERDGRRLFKVHEETIEEALVILSKQNDGNDVE